MKQELSRDIMAMEFAKVYISKFDKQHISLKDRIKKLFGKDYKGHFITPDRRNIAKMAYILADVMIKERENRHDNIQ